MTVQIKRLSDIYDKDVYTDAGMYFGKVGDAVLGKYMISGWVVKATPSSLLTKALKNVRLFTLFTFPTAKWKQNGGLMQKQVV